MTRPKRKGRKPQRARRSISNTRDTWAKDWPFDPAAAPLMFGQVRVVDVVADVVDQARPPFGVWGRDGWWAWQVGNLIMMVSP